MESCVILKVGRYTDNKDVGDTALIELRWIESIF